MVDGSGMQAVLLGAGAVVGLLGVVAAFWMERSAPRDDGNADIDRIVRDAPYERLDNILPAKRA